LAIKAAVTNGILSLAAPENAASDGFKTAFLKQGMLCLAESAFESGRIADENVAGVLRQF